MLAIWPPISFSVTLDASKEIDVGASFKLLFTENVSSVLPAYILKPLPSVAVRTIVSWGSSVVGIKTSLPSFEPSALNLW